VLAPQPSYPLVEHLTNLDGVSVEHYRLEFHGRWELDTHGLLEQASGGRIRAIIMISPNNPTGSVVTDAELDFVSSVARDRSLALISDEVFCDYPIAGAAPASALRQQNTLTFVLGGLSKSVGLPQVKLGWIAVGGPASVVADAMERLETICDAYLSVSTPVQVAAPELLKSGAVIRRQIQQRVRENYAQLTTIASAKPACAVMPVEAGWYAVVQVPAMTSEETMVVDLLEDTGVLVHPGYFFDFEREAFIVISLLPDPQVFASAAQLLFGQIGSLR
jgi:aspartate/methionine/tyrosine aminotransferase